MIDNNRLMTTTRAPTAYVVEAPARTTVSITLARAEIIKQNGIEIGGIVRLYETVQGQKRREECRVEAIDGDKVYLTIAPKTRKKPAPAKGRASV